MNVISVLNAYFFSPLFKGGVAIITTSDLTTMVYLFWLFISEEKNSFMPTFQLTFEIMATVYFINLFVSEVEWK